MDARADPFYSHVMSMISRRTLFAGAAAFGVAGCITASRPQAYALVGGAIVGSPHRVATIVVEGTRISAIQREAPSSAVVIDVSGKFIMPGLCDMHAHIATAPPVGGAPERYVGWGVLGIRDMGGDLPALLQLRREITDGRVGPNLYIAGPTLNGEQFAPFQRAIGNAEQARVAVRELKAVGVDFIKTHRATSRDAFFALVDEAQRQGLDVAGHVPLQVTWDEAAAVGMRTFEHAQTIIENELSAGPNRAESIDVAINRLQGARLNQITAALRSAGAYFDPTLIFYERSINNRPELAERRRQLYEMLKSWVGSIHSADVPILTGTDAMDDFGEPLHMELERLVECGLTNREALAAATSIPASLMRRSDLGVVERGAEASFLIIDADPLADVRNLRRLYGVVLRGRYLDAAELTALRQV